MGLPEDRLGKARNKHIKVCKTVKKKQGRLPKEPKLSPQYVRLVGTIPSVLRWVKERMEEEMRGSEVTMKATSLRSFAHSIHGKVRIIMPTMDYWKGDERFWENVCSLAAKLPTDGKASSIFEAMGRYPSSILVCSGLKFSFGRCAIAGKTISQFSLLKNAIIKFSPMAGSESFAKKWFDANTLPRLQELVIHMSAISEYVLRCAYTCKRNHAEPNNKEEWKAFLEMLKENMTVSKTLGNRSTLEFSTGSKCLSEEDLYACLEKSLNVAHEAVVQGTKIAVQKYGKRGVKGKERRRIQLWMLKRPLHIVMDALIRELEWEVRKLLGDNEDVDWFRLHMMRQLRKAELVYTEVGSMCFNEADDFKAPDPLPKGTKDLVSSEVYRYCHDPYDEWKRYHQRGLSLQ